MAYKIYLSPSNQSGNKYSTGNTNEMVQCDKIAKAAQTALTRCGFSAKVGKSGDTMANRCKESDNFSADIHIPIHTNAFNNKVTGGTLVMLYKHSDKHNKAGKALLDAVGKISPGSDYTLRYETNLYELNTPKAMSLYLEVEFHDTKEGSNWIQANTENIGEAIAKGMCNYYNVKYIAKNNSTNTKVNDNSKPMYYVQVGAFNSKANADAMVNKLKKAGFDSIIKTG